MKIKRQMPKLLSILLSFTISFSSVLPAYAAEVSISESPLEGAETVGSDGVAADSNLEVQDDSLEVQDDNPEIQDNSPEEQGSSLDIQADSLEAQADSDSRYELIEINYSSRDKLTLHPYPSLAMATGHSIPSNL